MSNAPRGTVTLDVGGKVYTMHLTFNAICQLEETLSTANKQVTFKEIAEMAERGSLRHVRAVVWAALLKHHPEMSISDAGELIHDAGGLSGLTKQISELSASLTPDERDVAELTEGGSKRPRKAQVA